MSELIWLSVLTTLLSHTALANTNLPANEFNINLTDEFEPLGAETGHYNHPGRIKHRATGMVLILIPGGTFTIGTPPDERERDRDETQRSVTIDHPFYLGEAEVTVGEWNF